MKTFPQEIDTNGGTFPVDVLRLHTISRETPVASASPLPALKESANGERLWRQGLPDLTRAIHASLDLAATADAIASAGAVWTGCDRVSVIARRGGRWKLLAATGQPLITPRAPAVRRLVALARHVAKSGRSWAYDSTAPLTTSSDQTKALLAEHLSCSASCQLLIEPLHRPRRSPIDQEPDILRMPDGPPLGVLVFENFAERTLDPQFQERVNILKAHAALALSHNLAWQRIWLRPARSVLGHVSETILTSGRLLGALAVLIVAAAIVALAKIPADVRIKAEGTLMPRGQARVYAPCSGQVVEILVRTGDRLEAGQPLLKVFDAQLQEELTLATGHLEEARQTLQGVKAEHHTAVQIGANPAETVRLQARLTQVQIEIAGHERHIQLLESEREKLVIRAPTAGQITTPDLYQRLMSRPLQRGDLLVEIADDTSPWQLELRVPEVQFGKFWRGAGELSPEAAAVEFRLLSQPQEKWTGRVREVSLRTINDPQHGPVVPVIVDVDRGDWQHAVGAQVDARLLGPRTCLGLSLFGDALDACYRWSWW